MVAAAAEGTVAVTAEAGDTVEAVAVTVEEATVDPAAAAGGAAATREQTRGKLAEFRRSSTGRVESMDAPSRLAASFTGLIDTFLLIVAAFHSIRLRKRLLIASSRAPAT